MKDLEHSIGHAIDAMVVASDGNASCNKNVDSEDLVEARTGLEDHTRTEAVEKLKASLRNSSSSSSSKNRGGIVLDIDETLAATNVKWFQRCIELFGNPEEELGGVDELIAKYHLCQNNPAWQNNPAARAWMHEQRTAPEAQDDLPVIDGAVEGVQKLVALGSSAAADNDDEEEDGNHSRMPVVAYLTVRPTTVNANTRQWLTQCGFPPALPILAKPPQVPFERGNEWKAAVLRHLWPEVAAIVDDNPKLPRLAGPHYKGRIYLFGRAKTEADHAWAVPCETWEDVVETIRKDTAIR